jgi:hypothetical protein
MQCFSHNFMVDISFRSKERPIWSGIVPVICAFWTVFEEEWCQAAGGKLALLPHPFLLCSRICVSVQLDEVGIILELLGLSRGYGKWTWLSAGILECSLFVYEGTIYIDMTTRIRGNLTC